MACTGGTPGTPYGRFAQAEHVHKRLVAKYPDSTLSRACEAYLDTLRSNPLLAGLRERDRIVIFPVTLTGADRLAYAFHHRGGTTGNHIHDPA